MHSYKVYWQLHYPHPFGGPRLIGFPKAFQTLYCTTQDNSSDSSGLERFRGAISSLSLFSFLKTRVMETFLNRYWMFVMAKISLKIYYDMSNILWWKHQRKAFFFVCVLYMKCINIVYFNSLKQIFGRAAMWVAQGLRPPHAFTLCALNHDCAKPH